MSVAIFSADFPVNPTITWGSVPPVPLVLQSGIDAPAGPGATPGDSRVTSFAPILPSGIHWQLMSYQIIAYMVLAAFQNQYPIGGKIGGFYGGLTTPGDINTLPRAPYSLGEIWTPQDDLDIPISNNPAFTLPPSKPFVLQRDLPVPLELWNLTGDLTAGLWLLPSTFYTNGLYLLCTKAVCSITVEG